MNRPVHPPESADVSRVAHKATDADVLGPARSMEPPQPGNPLRAFGDSAKQPKGTQRNWEAERMTPMQEAETSPPPTEDENQPGFIGERNRPHPS